MAEANISMAQDQFSCPICLDLLKYPVTIQCGHSYCMRCINDCWDQEDQKGVYSCPQCRQTFTPRPAVSKNTILAEVIETLKGTGLEARHPAGFEDVECDYCIGRKCKAVKSCLVCLASFCETHLQPHYESPAFKKHKLVEASRRLQEQICSQHGKLLEVYCRTDQKCICTLCLLDEHKGHDTVSAAAGREEIQKQLWDLQQRNQLRIQERQKDLQELRKMVETHKRSVQTAVQESERIFTELIRSFESRRSELTRIIRDQEEATVTRAESVIKQLEQEISQLNKRDAVMKELPHTEDPVHFLQIVQSALTPSGSGDLPTITLSSVSCPTFEAVIQSVSQLKKNLEHYCTNGFVMISSGVRNVQIQYQTQRGPPFTLNFKSNKTLKKVVILQPQSREEFLPFSCQLTLDPNTAHQRLKLSDSNKTATAGNIQQTQSLQLINQIFYTERYEHPESFSDYSQVLCKESVCGRSYWDVELSNSDGVSIAVSYKDISRKGSSNECVFGRNNKSWSLVCYSSYYSFLHNNQETRIQMNHRSSRIGVFVDYKSGTLSFYSVSDKMKLLHQVRTTFTQPLYPGFGLNTYSTVKLHC